MTTTPPNNGKAKPNKSAGASGASVGSDTFAELIAIYKDRLRATEYERIQLERKLAAADRDRQEIVTEVAASSSRWLQDVHAVHDAVDAVKRTLDQQGPAMADAARESGRKVADDLSQMQHELGSLRDWIKESSASVGILVQQAGNSATKASGVLHNQLDGLAKSSLSGMQVLLHEIESLQSGVGKISGALDESRHVLRDAAARDNAQIREDIGSLRSGVESSAGSVLTVLQSGVERISGALDESRHVLRDAAARDNAQIREDIGSLRSGVESSAGSVLTVLQSGVERISGALDESRHVLREAISTREKLHASMMAMDARHAAERAKLTESIDELKNKIAVLEGNLDAEHERAGALEVERQRLRSELTALESAFAASELSLRGALGDGDALAGELALLRGSGSYQLGQALSASVRSWSGARALPGRLFALMRSRSRTRPGAEAQQLPQTLSVDESVVHLVEAYARVGSDAFVALAADIQPAYAKAAVLTAFAKKIFHENPDAAILAGQHALALEPAPYRAKWLAFMSFDAGHVTAAAELLAQTMQRTDWKPSEKTRSGQIEAARRLMRALPVLQPRLDAPGYEPIPGRVIYVAASSLPYHQSGYTLRTQAICAALRAKGLDVLCVTRPGYPVDRFDAAGVDLPDQWEVDGVPYRRILAQGRALPTDEAIEEAALALYALITEFRPVIIHAASNHENALPALMAARRAGIPFAYEVRGLWDLTAAARTKGWQGSERDGLERDLEKLVANEADCLMTINTPIAEELAARGVATQSVRLVPNAVDEGFGAETFPQVAAPSQLDGADFTIGYAGSLLDYEGLDDLLRAVATLRRGAHPGVRALIVGSGSAETGLKALAATLCIEDAVAFVGRVSPKEARAFLRICDCVALPRKPVAVCHIVSPLKPVEAMALGLPVVVSDVRALREMVEEGRTGLVHSAGDPADLARALAQLAEDPPAARAMGEAARRHVLAHRTWPAVAGEMLRGYAGVVDAVFLEPLAQQVPQSVDELVLPIPATRNALTPDEKQQFDLALARAYQLQGALLVRRLVEVQAQGHSPKFVAFCALRGARLLLDNADDADAIGLVELAVSSSRDVQTLKGAATLLFNACQDEAAEQLLSALEQQGGMDESTAKFATQVRGRQALMALSAGPPAGIGAMGDIPPVVVNFLHFSLPYTSVGYATRSHGIARGVMAAGWDFRPFTRLGFPQDFSPELEDAVLPDSDTIDGVHYRRIHGGGRRGMSEVEYLSIAADRCEAVLKEQGATVVHAASNYTTALPALVASRRLGLPFVYEIRGFWEVTRSSRDQAFEKSRKYRTMKRYEDFVVANADRIITITSAMKEELMERGVPGERISLAYNSVDVSRFHALERDVPLAERLGIPENVPVIGYVGSFVDYEGLDDLLTAASILRTRGHQFRVLMVGDGAVMESLREMLVELKLEGWVTLTGRVPHEEVESYYSLIDVAPFPRKPWQVCELVSPLKPFEAMAMNKPVVVSGTRALLEIVTDGLNGLVFEKGNPDSLADALERLLVDPQLREDIGARSRAWVEEYRSWDRAGADVAAVYRDLLQSTHAHVMATGV